MKMIMPQEMERWIEKRLWDQKVNRETITIKQLISEMEKRKMIKMNYGMRKLLIQKIEQIRSRM